MKIAIVDDDKTMRNVLRAICESQHHEVAAEFGDGIGLREYVKNHRPDVVCLDYNLPGEDGLELMAHMDVAANQVDVIMITGSDDPELKGHAADLGAVGFIRKPFEEAQIIAELKAIEENRRITARAAETPDEPVPTIDALPVPKTPDQPKASVISHPAPGPAPAVVPRTAVIVDDSGSIRLLLKGILQEMGIKIVGSAACGSEGVEEVKRTHPELVCMDVDMPTMTGIEALPHVRAASPLSKVVMVTGNASRPIVEAAVSGGARGYFLKPIRPVKVEEFIRKLLRL